MGEHRSRLQPAGCIWDDPDQSNRICTISNVDERRGRQLVPDSRRTAKDTLDTYAYRVVGGLPSFNCCSG